MDLSINKIEAICYVSGRLMRKSFMRNSLFSKFVINKTGDDSLFSIRLKDKVFIISVVFYDRIMFKLMITKLEEKKNYNQFINTYCYNHKDIINCIMSNI